MIDTDKYEGHTEGPWEAGIDCPEDFEMGDPHEENFHFTLHEFWAVIPGTDAWRAARDGECDNPNEWYGYSERDPKQLRADVLLMADAPDLLAEVKRLREALITVQHSLIWDEKDREMDGDPITLEALVTQVEQVRSDITEMIE
jgi:hypothetical protein